MMIMIMKKLLVLIFILNLLITLIDCNNNEYKVSIIEEIDINTDIYNFRKVIINYEKETENQQQQLTTTIINRNRRLTTTTATITTPPRIDDENDDDDLKINQEFINLNYKYLNMTFNFLDSTKHSNSYFQIDNDNENKYMLKIKNKIDRDSLCENKLIKTCNCNSQCIIKLDILVNGYRIDKNSLKNQLLLADDSVTENNSKDEENGGVDVELINEIIALNTNNFFYHIFTLNIHVLDINDNKPYFLRKEYTIEIPENVPIGHRIPLQFIAYDSDYGKNSIVRYRLINATSSQAVINETILSENIVDRGREERSSTDGLFEIDYSNLKNLYLKVNNELDRELRASYNYYLVAIDGGKPIPLFGIVKLNIKILDHNDNHPLFKSNNLRLNISENTPIGTKLLNILAYDNDDGPNGQIEFFLVLNKNFQQQKLFSYQDQQQGNQVSSSLNSKQLIQSSQQLADDDNNYFRIDKTTGDLFLKEILDYEKQKYFKLIISAIDKGIPSLYSLNQCIIEIFIYDENDNAPEIRVITSEQIQQERIYMSKQQQVSGSLNTKIQQQQQQPSAKLQTLYIHESAPIGTFICLITINDIDTGLNGKFEWNLKINPNDGKIRLSDSYTKIDEILVDNSPATMKTYALLVAKSLDRETQSNYKIMITAKDFGVKKRLESELNINLIILDVNDNKPEFKLLSYSTKNEKSSVNSNGGGGGGIEYSYNINENNVINTKIGCFDCFDKDEGENSEIDYYLSMNDTFIVTSMAAIGEHINNVIRIDPTSKCLFALISFDRELREYYQFYIIAVDRSKLNLKLNSSALVKLQINDVNDHVPYFTQSKYVFNLTEHSPPNTVIGHLKAFDFDANDNSKLEFKFTPASNAAVGGLIKVNPNNGILSYISSNELDADKDLTEFNLEVHVNDKGVPSFGTSCQVQINIIDINDNCPIITSIANSDSVEHVVRGQHELKNDASNDDVDDIDDIEAILFYIDRDIIKREVFDANTGPLLIGRLVIADNDRDFINNQPSISKPSYFRVLLKHLHLPLGIYNEVILKNAYFNLTSDGNLYLNLIPRKSQNPYVNDYGDDDDESDLSYYLPSNGVYRVNFQLNDNSKIEPCIIKTKFILIAIGNSQISKNNFIKMSINLMKDIVKNTNRSENSNNKNNNVYLLNSSNSKSSLTDSNSNNNNNNKELTLSTTLTTADNIINHFNSFLLLDTSKKTILLIFFIILLLIIVLLNILCVYCICKYNRCCFNNNKKSNSSKMATTKTTNPKYKVISTNDIMEHNLNDSLNYKFETIVNKNGNILSYANGGIGGGGVGQQTIKSNNYKLLIEQQQSSLDSSPSNINKYSAGGTIVNKLNGSLESTYSSASSTSSPITTSTIASSHANKNRSVLV